jgi:predicted transcriptional regulator
MDKPRFAKDIMVTKLVTLTPEMDVVDAIERLVKNRISGAPVVDEDQRYLGVFSESSSFSALLDAAYHQLPSNQVGAFMDTKSKTIDEKTHILSMVQIFLDTRQRRLPVLRDEKLVGQISRRDVLEYVLDLFEVQANREKSLLYLSALWDRADAPIAH